MAVRAKTPPATPPAMAATGVSSFSWAVFDVSVAPAVSAAEVWVTVANVVEAAVALYASS